MTATQKTPAPKAAPVKMVVQLYVEIDPAKWARDNDAPVDAAKVAEALAAAGIGAEQAKQMAAKLAGDAAKVNVGEVRDDIRNYLADEAAKLKKLADAGAKVTVKPQWRPKDK